MNHRLILLIVIFLFAAPAPASAQEIRLSPDPQQRTVQDLKVKADLGNNAQAQLEFAKAVIQMQPDLAREYAQRAANQNLAEAWYFLATSGLGQEPANVYYEHAAGLGYGPAFLPLFDAVLFRAGDKADVVKAKQFAELARAQNATIPNGDAILNTIDICAAAGAPLVPNADRIKPEQKKQFATANCDALRADLQKNNQDLTNYRLCVLSKNPVNGGALAEIYANGWGAARNPKLAIAMLCHSSSSAVELQAMTNAVYQSRTQAALSKPFLSCDYITTDAGRQLCATRTVRAGE